LYRWHLFLPHCADFSEFATEPPGHVHTMIKNTWADKTLSFTHVGALPSNLTFAAQQGDQGLVLRAVNKGQAPLSLSIAMEAGACLSGAKCATATEATVSTLSGEDLNGDNSPSDVEAITPKSSKVALGAGGKSVSLSLPGYSFTVATVMRQ
jgi:hypothetical protein